MGFSEGGMGSNPISPPIDSFLMDIFNWTGNVTVLTGVYQNFMSLSGLAKQPGGTANLTQTASSLKFPAKTKPSQVLFSTRITGNIGGPSGTPREWKVQIRRTDGVTVVGSQGDVKVDGTDISNRDTSLVSFTFDENDPFTTLGTQLGLLNTSGQSITLTSVSIRVQRVINPE